MNGIDYQVIGREEFKFDFSAPMRIYKRDGWFIARGRDTRKKALKVGRAMTDAARMVNAAVSVVFDEGVPFPVSRKSREREFLVETKFFKRALEILNPLLPDLTDSEREDLLAKKMDRLFVACSAKRGRFRAKAELNKFTFFVTVTYSDDKMTEDEFVAKLRKKFSNNSTRKGWRVMGVFERGHGSDDDAIGVQGRLHFHGLVYVPDGALGSEIVEKKVFSRKKKAFYINHENKEFAEIFGLNDFSEISQFEIAHGNVLAYVLKYVLKSGNKVFYSRHLPSEVEVCVNENWVLAEWFNFVPKLVLCTNLRMFHACEERNDHFVLLFETDDDPFFAGDDGMSFEEHKERMRRARS